MTKRRHHSKRTNQNRDEKPTYSVIVGGNTEIWYLQMLRDNENISEFNIRPELAKKTPLSEQFETVKEKSRIDTEVFWIIDFDTVLKEEQEHNAQSPSPLEHFRQIQSELVLDYPNVTLLVNNPCLEYWFLLHFKDTGKPFNNCDEAKRKLKKELTDYTKTEKYFKNYREDIYQKLKAKLPAAIKRAKAKGDFDLAQPHKSISEIYKLFEKFNLWLLNLNRKIMDNYTRDHDFTTKYPTPNFFLLLKGYEKRTYKRVTSK